MEVCIPYFDPEYENLSDKIFGPRLVTRYIDRLRKLIWLMFLYCRVSVDNESCEKCTVVKVDSINKQGLLLKVVQVLTDKDLFITKSYISSDARWFMDVFHVKDKLGNKVTDGKVIRYVQQLATAETQWVVQYDIVMKANFMNDSTSFFHDSHRNANRVCVLQAIGERGELQISEEAEYCSDDDSGMESSSERTAIEMIGVNRPGLFSEISAALAEQRCNVVEAHAWSHNACLACIACISDESTSTCIDDPRRLSAIEDHLSNILGPSSSLGGKKDSSRSARTCSLGCDNWRGHAERRLHQLMLANQDFDGPQGPLNNMSSWAMNVDNYEEGRRTVVSIDACKEKGYTVVNVECLDRPKLMFDTVCTLTDMQYLVFHANITTSHGPLAHQVCESLYALLRRIVLFRIYTISDVLFAEFECRRSILSGARMAEYWTPNWRFSEFPNAWRLQSSVESVRWYSPAFVDKISSCVVQVMDGIGIVLQGIRLELDLQNNVRVLPYVTRTLREHGLTVAQADIAAHGEKTKNVFFIQDISGKEIDMGTVESMKKELEPLSVQVENAMLPHKLNSMERDRFSFVSLLRSQLERFSHSFISI
ncbi:hypothetical protein B296_00022430 [Ensete ventricosum]|uniref:ACT domain-containing protein ACR n=1 Tax=Ensete ventricosum TaxID=4639 RepID=A0A426YU27_ENSVE|nr:hypothetical protein B296_00022430 [Ensete ventricosum]